MKLKKHKKTWPPCLLRPRLLWSVANKLNSAETSVGLPQALQGDEPVLQAPLNSETIPPFILERIIRQQQARETLREHGQTPATHMLLVGPPGTGKTMTASALAGELNLPLFTVRLESLFSRFFGETAGKLRLLFDQVAQTRGVYLLDEFDALGPAAAIQMMLARFVVS